jgi:hypothetical protein
VELAAFQEKAAELTVAALGAATLASATGSGILAIASGDILALPFAIVLFSAFAFLAIFPSIIIVGIPLALLLRRFAHFR